MKKNNIDNLVNKLTYRADWSEEDGVYIARALELPYILAHGESAEGAIKELKIPVKEVLEAMKKEKQDLPEPFALVKFKGNFIVRTTPEMHKELTLRAAAAGISLNQFALTKLAK